MLGLLGQDLQPGSVLPVHVDTDKGLRLRPSLPPQLDLRARNFRQPILDLPADTDQFLQGQLLVVEIDLGGSVVVAEAAGDVPDLEGFPVSQQKVFNGIQKVPFDLGVVVVLGEVVANIQVLQVPGLRRTVGNPINESHQRTANHQRHDTQTHQKAMLQRPAHKPQVGLHDRLAPPHPTPSGNRGRVLSRPGGRIPAGTCRNSPGSLPRIPGGPPSEQPGSPQGDEGQGDKEGTQQGDHDGGSHVSQPDRVSGRLAKNQRHKDDDGGQGGCQHRHGHRLGPPASGRHPIVALLQPLIDRLQHHHRVIHQHPGGQHQAHHGQDVEGLAEEVEESNGGHDGKRNGKADGQRRSQPS